MTVLSRLLEGLKELAVDIDSDERLRAHRSVLARKPMLRRVFQEFHRTFRALDECYFSGNGLRIELGAGIAPVRESFPEVLATDILPAPHLDRVLDAQALDLPDGSVRALYCQNCFHHLGQPTRFFHELVRVAVPGGGAVLIEPFHGAFASFIYPRLFVSERFDKAAPWETPTTGPMSNANQALSYIIFERDRALFERKFPELELVHCRPLAYWLRYILSGGLNFRQLIPQWLERPVAGLEWLLAPGARVLALHQVIVLRRRGR